MSLTINGKRYEGVWANLLAIPIVIFVYAWLAFIFALVAALMLAPFWIPIVLIVWLT